MADVTLTVPLTMPAGEVVALDVSADDYMERYAADYHEWVRGMVIKMSPVSFQHDGIMIYVRDLLRAYFSLTPIGQVIGAPFVMQLDVVPSRREPDLQVILQDNLGKITPTRMIGAADIAIEVVSTDSVARDYGDKFAEYETGGVREYWIIDPIRTQCQFYRLEESGHFHAAQLDADDHYTTPLLPRLKLHVPTLWRDNLPDFFAIGDAVREMLKD